MITIQLVSEDFSAQDLLAYLEEKNVTQDLNIGIVKAEKEGLSLLHDALEFVFSDEMGREMAKEILKEALKFAGKKALEYASPDEHILIKYSNGQSKKIFYKGKSEAVISRELLAEIGDGEVVKVMFKS